jgi:hypothetical protein
MLLMQRTCLLPLVEILPYRLSLTAKDDDIEKTGLLVDHVPLLYRWLVARPKVAMAVPWVVERRSGSRLKWPTRIILLKVLAIA